MKKDRFKRLKKIAFQPFGKIEGDTYQFPLIIEGKKDIIRFIGVNGKTFYEEYYDELLNMGILSYRKSISQYTETKRNKLVLYPWLLVQYVHKLALERNQTYNEIGIANYKSDPEKVKMGEEMYKENNSTFRQAFLNAGVTAEYLANKLKEMLEAEDIKVNSIIKLTELIMRLVGALEPEKVDIQVSQMSNTIEELYNKRIAEKSDECEVEQ